MSNTAFHQKLVDLSDDLYLGNDLPARYVFVLTDKCNLNCPFCFQDNTDKMVLSSLVWKNLINQIPEYGRVTLTGGEPLLYQDFEEVFTHITKQNDCNLITNGLLLSEEILTLLLSKEKFKVLSISIDSLTNDVRQMTTKQWSQLLVNIKTFHKLRKSLKSEAILDIKCTVLDQTYDSLYDIYNYVFDELHCDTFAFQFLKGSDSQHATKAIPKEYFEINNDYKYTNWEKIKESLLRIRSSAIEKQRSVFLHPSLIQLTSNDDINHLDIIQKPFSPDAIKPCIYPWSSIHINYDGNIYPCLSYKWGNIQENSLKEIISSTEAQEFKSIIHKRGTVPACKNCGWIKGKTL